MDRYMWEAVIWGFGIISFLSYVIWFDGVKNKALDKRMDFFIGMIPSGYIVLLIIRYTVPDVLEFFIRLKDGCKYYWRQY